MKIAIPKKQNRAMTLLELFVVLAVISLLAIWVGLELRAAKARSQRIWCTNYLKQIGLAYRIWDGNHGINYPMAVSETNGGSMEFITGPNAFRHLQVMSNELSTPYILLCLSESDPARILATNFTHFNNSNLSYFIGVDANEANPQMILAGDRNITNGTAIKNGVLELTTGHPAGWTSELHNKVGNILLADGSVQQVSISGLQNLIANTGVATNRLQMPVTGP
jgi:prepilin-type N-terminal cleavage/methylation domain-containing protein/prepilin-type processing-associated H-X9-DG protein